ncbi:hypothetical protein PIPA1_29820 [Pelosinus sp. IPA-1]|nr:hypothetical protein PIPA1_29820 [Pelosinus sp. IPA-1]
MPSPRTQAEALVVLTWNQENVILSDSVKKVDLVLKMTGWSKTSLSFYARSFLMHVLVNI